LYNSWLIHQHGAELLHAFVEDGAQILHRFHSALLVGVNDSQTNSLPKDLSAVREAVRTTAALLRLKLRPATRSGRPRESESLGKRP